VSKRGRLSRSGDFDRVYREGDSRANRFLVLYSFPRAEAGAQMRFGMSVGRKVGNAVVRNKVKRRLRDAFRSLSGKLPEGHDFVVVARPGVEDLVDREGPEGLERALAELVGDPPTGAPGQERLT
jgi:ribonuclease P protein component